MLVMRHRPNLFVTFAIVILFLIVYYGYDQQIIGAYHRNAYKSNNRNNNASWDYIRDAKNLKFTDAQCDAAFPSLFAEIDRAVESRKNNHVTLEEMEEIPIVQGFARAMIYENELYVIEAAEGVNTRDLATLHAIHRALLTSPEPLPNIEFTFNADDKVSPEFTTWSYARLAEHTKSWLMPDFGYWSWPEPKIGTYHEVQMKAQAMDSKVTWRDKIPKLVWRGAIMQLKTREDLLRAAEGKHWSAVKELNWEGISKGEQDNLITMDQHCAYRFVAHTEGVSYSARLQNLQNCRSVVVAHKLKWIQHHSHLMSTSGPDQNFVEVKEDFSDLDETMQDLISKEKDEEMQKIAENNVRMFGEHYITPAAETCYWRKLIRGWATVSPEPEFIQTKDGKQVWRGVPVESYFLMGKVDWKQH